MLGFAGTSNTAILGIWQTYAKTQAPIDHPAYLWSYLSSAVSGANCWGNAFYYDSLSTANVVTIDQSNDYNISTIAQFEGFIRRVLADGKRIIPILLPRWNALDNGEINTPLNEIAYNAQKAVCQYYGLSFVDGWAYVLSVVPSVYDLSDLYGDVVHLTATGGEKVIYDNIQSYLPTGGSASLPAVLNAGADDFAQATQRIVGTGYDSRTGTGWADDGTKTSSTTADDTITFSGTFRSFGAYAASGTNSVTASIDGGDFISVNFNTSGYDIGTRAAHTVIIKVVTGCYIDEFWAI